MNYFDYSLEKLNEYEQVRDCLSRKKSCQVTGCGDSQLAHFINGLSNGYKQKVIVTFSAIKAKELYDDMKGFTDDVVMYPAKDLIFFSADVHGSYIEIRVYPEGCGEQAFYGDSYGRCFS